MNLYQDLFELIQTYLFGGVELSAHQDLVAVTLATIGVLFVFSIPFVVIWRVIKLITGE